MDESKAIKFFKQLVRHGKLECRNRTFYLKDHGYKHELIVADKKGETINRFDFTQHDFDTATPPDYTYRLMDDVQEMCLTLLKNGYELNSNNEFDKKDRTPISFRLLVRFAGKPVKKEGDWAFLAEWPKESLYDLGRCLFDECIVQRYDTITV